ncbi:MAG TPA: hypothetical protein VI818_01525, partial [Candidatus Thermoplasmatota archaeon]|nr:hypothetical protein [Candidatus Thermoplasmatota archaeon]
MDRDDRAARHGVDLVLDASVEVGHDEVGHTAGFEGGRRGTVGGDQGEPKRQRQKVVLGRVGGAKHDDGLGAQAVSEGLPRCVDGGGPRGEAA